jgi:type I restriction enzyme M protein
MLPENLFYNTTAPGIIMVINKKPAHEGIMLINGSGLFKKGKPKNYLPDESIEVISGIYREWKEEEGISRIISKEEVIRHDYNLSPSRYVANNGGEEALPLEEAFLLLRQAEEERKEADLKMKTVLEQLGIRL